VSHIISPAPRCAIGLFDVTQQRIRILSRRRLEPDLEPHLTTASSRWRTKYAASLSLDAARTGRHVASNILIRSPPLSLPNAKRNLSAARNRAAPFQKRRYLANSISKAHVPGETSVPSSIQTRLQPQPQSSVPYPGTLSQAYRADTFKAVSVKWESYATSVTTFKVI
jgi:hypothetical protein